MKLYILNTGYLETDKNNVVACSAIGTYSQPQVTNKWIKLPVVTFLIDTGGGYILYDTDSDPETMNGYWPKNLQEVYPLYQKEEEHLENQLVLVGVKPKDIKMVAVSHMHLDHVGNLHLFPHAGVYAPKVDFLNAQARIHLNPDPTTYGGYVRGDVGISIKQYHLIDSDFELVPGVGVVNLPDHTPGPLGLVVHMENNTFILPQDAVYTSEICGPPTEMPGLLYDSLAHFQSVQKVHNLREEYNSKTVFAYDYEFFRTLKTAPHYYN